MQMIAAIEPRGINWDLIKDGDDDESKTNNAKYVISLARSIGAVLFCVPEDFVEVKPKQMLVFFAVMFELKETAYKAVE
jgi:hypothetical protein